jgi:deoxyribodipyrimidine photo-lyase
MTAELFDTLPPPTHAAALAAVARIRPDAYARMRNHLDGAVTGLSPWLTHGVVTLPEVLGLLLQRQALPVQHKLVFEFGWREYFRHVWAHRGDGILLSLHEGPKPEAAYAPALPDDIRQARTGLPVIDEAVRTLYTTGTLHNHARMWLASYVVHLRQVHWRAGADWLVAHLQDGDLASNHLSWQWVAGTGSHKSYLFNADNVARYAPPAWHSPGSVIDTDYSTLEMHARSTRPAAGPGPNGLTGVDEPVLLPTPPAGSGFVRPGPADAAVQGREVWLLHPWALRAPPPALAGADSPVCIGIALAEHHATWPWPARRWQWVQQGMAAHSQVQWFGDLATLQAALQGARAVRSVAEPHLAAALPLLCTELLAPPTLFAPVSRRCDSFSQWWTRTTRGLHDAAELIASPSLPPKARP